MEKKVNLQALSKITVAAVETDTYNGNLFKILMCNCNAISCPPEDVITNTYGKHINKLINTVAIEGHAFLQFPTTLKDVSQNNPHIIKLEDPALQDNLLGYHLPSLELYTNHDNQD